MNLLIVEDDISLCDIIHQALIDNGYQAEFCHDGDEAVFYASQYDYDLIILDRMLPSKDGLQVLKDIRNMKLTQPVIFITAMGGLDDRINGLDAGADDYLVKPFSIQELLARIRALLRRPRESKETSQLYFEGLTLNTNNYSLSFLDNELKLSQKESDLLEYFMLHPCATLDRERIITRVWGSDAEITEGNLDNYIYFLRRHIKQLKAPVSIKNIHGKGYLLERG